MPRIAIIADVHIGLLGPQPDGSVFGDPTPMLERAIPKLLEINPEKLVLLGDVVNRGNLHEYERARQILTPFAGKIEPMVGNHELQRADTIDFRNFWGVHDIRLIDSPMRTELYLNSGLENLPDSQWHGRLCEAQLHLLRAVVALRKTVPLLVFCHHPIKGTVAVSSEPMFGLDNSAEVDRILTQHPGPVIFISAHTHSSSIVRRGPMTYLGCGPLGFWPHAFLVLDIDENRVEFRTVCVCSEPSESPDAGAGDAAYRACREGCDADRAGTILLR
jgi:3',5'-cyclic AMP phosphodiesterase CpdA